MSAVAAPSAFAPSTTSLKPRTRDARKGRRAVTPSRAVTASTGTLEKLYLEPIKKIEGTVTLPGSKSMSNRILLLAALAKGKTKVLNLLDSDDIRFMVDALKQLGLDFGCTPLQGLGFSSCWDFRTSFCGLNYRNRSWQNPPAPP